MTCRPRPLQTVEKYRTDDETRNAPWKASVAVGYGGPTVILQELVGFVWGGAPFVVVGGSALVLRTPV